MIKDVIAKIDQSRIRKCLTSALHRLGVRLARECPLIAFLRGFGVDEVRDFPDARFWTASESAANSAGSMSEMAI
jgi:hypothetical protein